MLLVDKGTAKEQSYPLRVLNAHTVTQRPFPVKNGSAAISCEVETASKAKAKGQLAQPPGGRTATSRQQAGNQQGKRREHTHKQNETAIHNKVPDQGQLLWSQRHDSPKERHQITEALDAEG